MTSEQSGIRAAAGLNGVRGGLWPYGRALGLASALMTGEAVAQQTPSEPPAAATPAEPAVPAPPPAEAEPPARYTLPAVEVEGESETSGYQAERPQLPRAPRPVVNTPQTLTVVPKQVIEEQRAVTVRDALRNVSGITVTAGEGGRQGDTFNLRGFSAQTDTFRDGVRDLGWFTRDTFNLQGVEVYFGPSAVLFGRGSTGGAINLITKAPTRQASRAVTLSGGTAPSGRLDLDLNQPLTDDLSVRVNAMGQLANVAGRRGVEANRAGVAPSVHLKLGEQTELNFDYLYQHEDATPDYGLPYFDGAPVANTLGVPRETFYGVAGVDKERVNTHVATSVLRQRLGEAGLLTNTLRLGISNRFARPTAPRGLTPAAEPTAIGRQRFETDTRYTYFTNQTNLRWELATGLLKHHGNVGLELSQERRWQSRQNLLGTPAADLVTPQLSPNLDAVQSVFGGSNASEQLSMGLYVSDQVELTRFFELLGSLRFDFFETAYRAEAATGALTQLKRGDRILNGQVGLVVHPLPLVSVYASYGTSANPSAEAATLSDATQTLEPERNATVELGAKAELIEGKLSLSGSGFRVDKLNARVPNPDPEGPPQILEGKQRVQGFNVGAAGTVVGGWGVFANYTFLHSEIVAHPNEYLVGQWLPQAPRHSLSLWTTWKLGALSLGAGATFQSAAAVNNPANEATAVLQVPEFWRFDAVLGYAWSRAEVQLNLYNLTNALYYEQYQGGHAVPAPGRSALLTVRTRF